MLDPTLDNKVAVSITGFEGLIRASSADIYTDFFTKIGELTGKDVTLEALMDIAKNCGLRLIEVNSKINGQRSNFMVVRMKNDQNDEIFLDPEVYLKYVEVEDFLRLDFNLERVLAGEVSEDEFRRAYYITNDSEYAELIYFYQSLMGRMVIVQA